VTRRLAALALAASVLVPAVGHAQTVRIGVFGTALTHTELNQDRRSFGGGGGGTIVVRLGRFGLDLSGFAARLDSAEGGSQKFDMIQGDARLNFLMISGLALEVGASRRRVEPEFAVQDVGLGRIGLLSEIPVSRAGSFWGRAAYLVAPQFNGGGDAGLAFEVGFGAAFGTRNGRFRGRVDYEFQRIDRTVNQQDVPIQVSMARLGIEVGF
jgi:hypothetical protein